MADKKDNIVLSIRDMSKSLEETEFSLASIWM